MYPTPCVIFSDMLRSCWPSAERPDWRITPFADIHDFLFSMFTAAISVWRQMCPVSRLVLLSQCLIPVVTYACGTWSCTVRNEHGPRVLENTVLRRILGRKREDVRGGWWQLRKEDRHNLRCSREISRIMKSGLRWVEYIDLWGRLDVQLTRKL
jgi:hypothetical protein